MEIPDDVTEVGNPFYNRGTSNFRGGAPFSSMWEPGTEALLQNVTSVNILGTTELN